MGEYISSTCTSYICVFISRTKCVHFTNICVLYFSKNDFPNFWILVQSIQVHLYFNQNTNIFQQVQNFFIFIDIMNVNPLPNSVEDNVIHVNLFYMLKHKLYIFIGRTIRVGFGCMISKEFLGIKLGLLPEDVVNFLLDKRLFSLFILLGTFLMKCFVWIWFQQWSIGRFGFSFYQALKIALSPSTTNGTEYISSSGQDSDILRTFFVWVLVSLCSWRKKARWMVGVSPVTGSWNMTVLNIVHETVKKKLYEWKDEKGERKMLTQEWSKSTIIRHHERVQMFLLHISFFWVESL